MLGGVLADLPADLRRRSVAIGISSMGPVDPWRGLVVDPPNVVALRDAPLADQMEARVGLPAYLERGPHATWSFRAEVGPGPRGS